MPPDPLEVSAFGIHFQLPTFFEPPSTESWIRPSKHFHRISPPQRHYDRDISRNQQVHKRLKFTRRRISINSRKPPVRRVPIDKNS